MPLPPPREGMGTESAAAGEDQREDEVGEYLVADDLAGIISLAQMGVLDSYLELHRRRCGAAESGGVGS